MAKFAENRIIIGKRAHFCKNIKWSHQHTMAEFAKPHRNTTIRRWPKLRHHSKQIIGLCVDILAEMSLSWISGSRVGHFLQKRERGRSTNKLKSSLYEQNCGRGWTDFAQDVDIYANRSEACLRKILDMYLRCEILTPYSSTLIFLFCKKNYFAKLRKNALKKP